MMAKCPPKQLLRIQFLHLFKMKAMMILLKAVLTMTTIYTRKEVMKLKCMEKKNSNTKKKRSKKLRKIPLLRKQKNTTQPKTQKKTLMKGPKN